MTTRPKPTFCYVYARTGPVRSLPIVYPVVGGRSHVGAAMIVAANKLAMARGYTVEETDDVETLRIVNDDGATVAIFQLGAMGMEQPS